MPTAPCGGSRHGSVEFVPRVRPVAPRVRVPPAQRSPDHDPPNASVCVSALLTPCLRTSSRNCRKQCLQRFRAVGKSTRKSDSEPLGITRKQCLRVMPSNAGCLILCQIRSATSCLQLDADWLSSLPRRASLALQSLATVSPKRPLLSLSREKPLKPRDICSKLANGGVAAGCGH